jgi:hypothetical protein
MRTYALTRSFAAELLAVGPRRARFPRQAGRCSRRQKMLVTKRKRGSRGDGGSGGVRQPDHPSTDGRRLVPDLRKSGLREGLKEARADDGNAEGPSGERVDVGDGGRPEGLERSPQRRPEFGRRPVVG